MRKIVEAVNKMIENSHLISNVIKEHDEYYFLYNNKTKWSISTEKNSSNDVELMLYPDSNMTIEDLINTKNWNIINYVHYRAADFKTQEATETFNELFLIVKEKVYGIDSLLDDIIES